MGGSLGWLPKEPTCLTESQQFRDAVFRAAQMRAKAKQVNYEALYRKLNAYHDFGYLKLSAIFAVSQVEVFQR